MIRRKFKYKSTKGVFLHEVLQKGDALEGWEMFSVIQQRDGLYIGVLKKRVR